jgi:hypothetical protein
MLKKIFSFSNATLLVALALSSIAAWYSIIGLTAIFSGAVIPIIIMGSALELAKITTTVWLRKYWKRSGLLLKLYLIPAVVALALLTSMGIFGFLSKAHLDQNIGSGDVQAQVSLLDEKILTQRENIKANKAALAQMDTQVNDIMTKGDSEKSVERSVAIRKQQAKERASLQKDIELANKEIARLNEERAPIASELRKVEAEVGPIKYIAALIYGDDTDHNTLESAVRWVIILLVIVFDPLAIMLVLAANASKEWDNEEGDSPLGTETPPSPTVTEPTYDPDDGPINADVLEQLRERAREELPTGEMIIKSELFTSDPTINCHKCNTALVNAPGIGLFCPNKKCDVKDGPFDEDDNTSPTVEEEEAFKILEKSIEEQMADTVEPDIEFEGVKNPDTKEWIQTGPVYEKPTSITSTYKDVGDGYVEYEGKKMSKSVLQSMRPDLFIIQEDDPREIAIDFGSLLPNTANMGDTFIKTDYVPHRVFKYNGTKWMEVDKTTSGVYLGNTAYLQSLMEKIAIGEYDPDLLTDYEQDAIANFIKTS